MKNATYMWLSDQICWYRYPQSQNDNACHCFCCFIELHRCFVVLDAISSFCFIHGMFWTPFPVRLLLFWIFSLRKEKVCNRMCFDTTWGGLTKVVVLVVVAWIFNCYLDFFPYLAYNYLFHRDFCLTCTTFLISRDVENLDASIFSKWFFGEMQSRISRGSE